MKIIAIIPARHASSRFPQKPLALIHGKPMILWVAELTAKAVGCDQTYVATDHISIVKVVEAAGFQTVMTSPDALTGTDRIAEAAVQIPADLYLNVQGDEPMLDPNSIQKVVDAAKQYPGEIINGFARLRPGENPEDVNIPKCVITRDGHLLYMSRAAIPAFKDTEKRPASYNKQICIYAFNREQLDAFAAETKKGPLETFEDIEILRFLDLGYKVRMIELPDTTIAVDVPDDIHRVELQIARERAAFAGKCVSQLF